MSKTTAFIGTCGPFGYDYKHPAPVVDPRDGSSPNPVLENVLGLLLCYDELIFLAPQFCPADMRELPYVKFLSDIPGGLEGFDAASTAGDPQLGSADFDQFGLISDAMTADNPEQFNIDNHTHAIHLDGGRIISGDSMRVKNALLDFAPPPGSTCLGST